MFTNIKELTEILFEKVSYSKRSEGFKDRVSAALAQTLDGQKQAGRNDVQALGDVMSRFGTYETATAFAGGEASEILREQGADKKAFLKKFRRVKLFSILLALWLTTVVSSVVQLVSAWNWFSCASTLFGIVTSVLFIWLFLRSIRAYAFERVCLSPEAREAFYARRDRYKKQFINSLFLMVLAIMYVFSSVLDARMLNMNQMEQISVAVSYQAPINIALFILLKNAMYLLFLLHASTKEEQTGFRSYALKAAACCAAFLGAAIPLALLADRLISNHSLAVYLLTGLFMTIGLLVNFHARSKLMRRNFCISKWRTTFYSLIVAAALLLSFLKSDVYVLQPYIASTSYIQHAQREIRYDEDSGVYTILAGDEDFRILHLTDIHLGGSVNSAYKDYKALEACRRLIEYAQPDLVVITGDLVFPMGIMSMSLNNEAPVRQFAAFMRNIGIPWAFTFGNHDTESMATGSREDICNLYKTLSWKTSGNLLYPYDQPEITGRSNQLIKIVNPDGSIREALFLLDSNDYTGEGLNVYDYIHDDQVEWYASRVKEMSEEQGENVPSMVFFHIPLQEYRTAYELYQSGSDEAQYHFGKIGETMINAICCSDYPSRLFDTAVELGSTQAMFCGHDHYNNISLTYRGIRLNYGMSIDYLVMPGIDRKTEQRGAELIIISEDSGFTIEQIPLTSIE